MSYKDKKPLPQEPGATNTAGPTAKVKTVPRATFRASIGHGSASGGDQRTGSESGDPTIRYRNAITWAKSMGPAGSFGTPVHQGKQPINYDEDLSSYLEEY